MRKVLFLTTLLSWIGFAFFAVPPTLIPTIVPSPVVTNTIQPTVTPVTIPTATPTVTPNTSTLEKSDWLVILPSLLTFIAAVITSCAWPITILLFLAILRKPIIDRLEGLSLFRFKDLEFEFGKRVQKLEEDADQANLPPTKSATTPKEGELPPSEHIEAEIFAQYQDRLYRLADVSPRSAVI